MAIKSYDLNGIGTVRVQKRRGTKNMKLRVSQDGLITVSVPTWVPYRMALEFAKSKSDWLKKHAPPRKIMFNGQIIGKTHELKFIEKNITKPRATIKNKEIHIYIPVGSKHIDDIIQLTANKGAKKALIKQSDILKVRLDTLSKELGLKYSTLSFKFMKSKWGSCNSDRHITLNYRLLDLPNNLIDYVLIHELTHLKHLNHSKRYWLEVQKALPDYKSRLEQIKSIKLTW